MIRRTLKDKELATIQYSDIQNMSDGDVLEVYLDAPITTNGYFLGYSGSTVGKANSTDIYSELQELAYLESKMQTTPALLFNLKDYSGTKYLVKDYTNEITELPVITVRNVILSNTYNGTTRFLGVNGTSVTSTTSQATAESDEIYHWTLMYNSAGRFNLYNPKANRYIRYTNSAFSINTTSSSLYVGYSTTNRFTIMGSNGSNYMYMSGTSTLARNQRTAQYWKIYCLETGPVISGSTSGRAPVWKYPSPITISQSTPTSTSDLVAGYKANELLRIAETSGNTTLYLNHKTSVSNLQFTTGGTSTESTWILFNKNATSQPEPPAPINPQIDADWQQNRAGGSYSWDYATGDFEMTFTGTNQKLMFWMHDETTLGDRVYWGDLQIYENGVLITDHSKYVSVGFYCGSNPKYSVTQGCTPTKQSCTDSKGQSHNAIQFNTSSSVSEQINWPLTFRIIGMTFE